MTQQIINTGVADKGNGDPLRTAFTKVNDNFTQLFNHISAGVVAGDTPPEAPGEGDLWWDSTSGRLYVYYGTAWVDASPVDGAGPSLGNWAFDSDSATVSGTTLQIVKNSSETITEETPGGTISSTTVQTSQVEIDATSIVITRSVSQTNDDGVTTVTDEAGSVASVGNGTAYLKTYDEPDGPNNTLYSQVVTTGGSAYLESKQEDVGGYTLGSVNATAGGVRILTHSINDKIWDFDQDGILTLPSNSYLETTDANLKIGSQGTVTIRSNAESNLTDREWVFNRSGTLETPLMLPTTFTATVDAAHYVGEGSLTLTGTAWHFEVTFAVNPDGIVETQIVNNTPWPSNPGYANDMSFNFAEADHGIPGYVFTLTLVNIQTPSEFVVTTNLAASVPPDYPSTINSDGTIKLTSNGNSWIFGSDSSTTLPAGALNLTNGDDRVGTNGWNQIVLGYSGSTGYPHFIRTRHDDSVSANNAIDFWISDSTVNSTSPVRALSVQNSGVVVGNIEVQGHLKGVDGGTGTTGQVLTRQSNGGVAWADAASGSSDRITGGNGILSINGGAVQIMPAPSGNVRIYPGATSAVMTIQGSSNTRLEYISSWDEVEDPPLPAGRNTLTQIDVSAGGVSINNSRTTGLGNDYDYVWVFDNNGNLQLPSGGDIIDSTGTTVLKTNLSQFTNDLEIDANTLTGTTLANNVTDSSLTSVGTLTGVTSSGVVHITNTQDSTNADTGALQVDGGAHITKNLIAEGTIYAGVNAYSEVLTNPLMVASAPSGVSGGYSQVAILNNTAEASGDFQVMVDGYDVNVSDSGWADLGMAGSNFSDPRYTITQPGDGYVFVSGIEGSTNRGSLVLATDGSGTTNDIVFATGGFLTANEKMRLSNTDGSLTINSGVIKTPNSLLIDVGGGGNPLEIQSNGQVSFSAAAMWNVDSGNPANINYVSGGSEYFIVTSPSDIKLRTGVGLGTKFWTLDTSGDIHLPAGGDILDSNGASVLGAGSYSLPTASTSVLGGVKVDGTTIVIDGSGVISSTVVGATILKGTWDASTNTPTLSSSLPSGVTVGWQYLVSVTGTRDIGSGSQTYTAGDIVLYDGVQWVDIPGAAGSVSSFNNRTGAVSLTSGDVTTALGFTPIQNSSLSVTTNSPGTEGLSYSNGAFTFTPALDITGNAATATKLATARNINGVAFDGTGSITVTAAAGTLTGTTLNAGITGSSLTSVGTLTNLTVTNPITGSVTGSAGSVAASALTGTTLASTVVSSSLTSVGTLANLTVTNTITGSVSGNAGTVTNGVYTTDTGTVTNTMLANSSITINGTSVALGGSTTVTASADAGTLTGTTLASGVTASSLTSVGTLTSLTTSGSITRSGAISASAWTTAGIGLKLPAATYTDTTSSGSVTNNFIHTIGAPTITSTSVTTVGTAANLYIAGDPVAGANTTLSGSYSLYVGGKTTFVGTVRFNGNILSGGGAAMLGFSNTTATAYADLSVSGQTYHPNRTAFRVVGNSSTAWTTTSPTGGVMTNSQWTQDYQTGTALGGGTGIFTAPYAGLYSVTLSARCKDNASPTAQCMIQKTAVATSTTSTVCMLEWAANTTVNHIGTANTVKLAVGDTLKFLVTVGSINFDSNDSYSVTFLG